MSRVPTGPLGAGTLIVGYAVAVASGSRALGGVVLLLGGGVCALVWAQRNGPRTALVLTGMGFAAFVLSHALGLVIGAWPAVLLVSAVAGVFVWLRYDTRGQRGRPLAYAARSPSR